MNTRTKQSRHTTMMTPNRTPRLQLTMKVVLLLGAYVATAEAFARPKGASTFLTTHQGQERLRHRPVSTTSSKRAVTMFLDDVDTNALPQLNILSSHSISPLPLVPSSRNKATEEFISSSSNMLSDSTLFEAELLNGLAHMALDFSALWGAATLALRLAAVVGRMCVVASDFAPDKEILPDELAFQLGLLFIAFNALINCALPKIRASLAPPLMTSQDRQAFRALFRPAGLSWAQYRELNLCAMDWVTVEPGAVVTSDEQGGIDYHGGDGDSVYWLYRGEVEVHSGDKLLHNVSRGLTEDNKTKEDQQAAGLGLFGEMRLAKLLDGQDRRKPTTDTISDKDNKKKGNRRDSPQRKCTVVAGDSGATLLRMNTAKLEKLIQYDQDLTKSINRLVFKGMQDKLNALLLKA